MEYKVNYNNRFKRDVTTFDSEEYKLFFNFLNLRISSKVQSLINETKYKSAAYWNSILTFYKKDISELDEQSLALKWKEAFDNGYDIKNEIVKRLNLINVNQLETGSNELDIRVKTVYRIVTNFTNYFTNLNIPQLEEVIPNFIEKDVLYIMQKFSPKWNNKNSEDVAHVIGFFNKKFLEIKELWLREVATKSKVYKLGLKEFLKNYVRRNILNEINKLSNGLIENIASKNWSFKNNLNSYEVDDFGKTNFHMNEINDHLLENFKLILNQNFKIENYSDVEVSLINLSKSVVRENADGFKQIDVFLEGSIKLKLGNESIVKNLKIKVPNVLFYNPKEEFESLINDLVNEINDKRVFKIEEVDFLNDKINNLEQLYDWFNKNKLISLKLSKLEKFRIQFPSFGLTDFKIEFVNSFVNNDPNIINVKYRKIKLEFSFKDFIKNTDEKIFSNEILVFSTKLDDLQKLIDFLAANDPKYLFVDEWDRSNIQNHPKKIFPKNDKWIELLKAVSPDDKWYKKFNLSRSDKNFNSYPKFDSYTYDEVGYPLPLLLLRFEAEVNWKYSSLNDKYAGWNESFKKILEHWWGGKIYQHDANSQKEYMENWIDKKLKVNSLFVKNNLKNLQASPIRNFNFTFEDIFPNLNELGIEAKNLDLRYRRHFLKYASEKGNLYVSFSFYNSKHKKVYTIIKPIFKKANTDEINKISDKIDEIHKKSLNQLNKINFSNFNEEKKFSKKFQDLYNESQKNYFQNKDFLNSFVNEIKLEQILEDYKANTKKIWIEILRSKHKEKVQEIENLKGASDEEKKKLLEQLDEELLASLSKINDLNFDYENIEKILNSVDWNFEKILNSKVIISNTFKYILASSAGILALGSIASGATLVSLIRSKKKSKKNNLKFKSRKGLILLTSLIGIASTIGSTALSLFVFVSQGGF